MLGSEVLLILGNMVAWDWILKSNTYLWDILLKKC